MSYKTYEKYKDSGIEWIGEIPKQWNVIKAKHCFSISGGYAFKSSDFVDDGCYLVRIGDITDGNINLSTCKKLPLEFANIFKDYLISEGDILIALTGDIGKIGKVPKNESKLLLNQRVGKLNSYFPDYFKYVIGSSFFKVQMDLISFGTAQENISTDNIGNCYVLDTGNEEKVLISNFLDKKTSQIDENITKNKELITLLEEKKASLINQVVTKGLDSDVPMKDSGIEWIGEIPEHWELTKIRFLGTLQNGISKSSEYFGQGYPFVSYGDVYNHDEIPDIINGKADTTKTERVLYSLKKNDILFTRTSETIEEVGISSLCTKDIPNSTFSGFLIRLRLFKDCNLNINFLKFYLSAELIRHYFAKMMVIVTRASLGQNLLNDLVVLVPPIEEQEPISEYLIKEIYNIDKSIEKIGDNIKLLEEYKNSLIYHVVTGKIDVRDENIIK